ncbi:MAG TPA: amidohydrolase family protein [Beijerinckiaceae bacterium]|jgi:predicted TIM-barrel fold metal-dependent hydrolase
MDAARPLVDCHAHVYLRSMPMSGEAWHAPPADATIESYLATLDAHGVCLAVLAAASIYGDYNDYAMAAVRAHKRLRTTLIVSPEIEASELRRLRDDGAVGVRFQFRNVAAPPDLTSFPYRKLMRRVADLGMHVHLHDEGDRIARFIDPILDSGARLVIDHYGRPTDSGSPGFEAVLRAVDRGAWVKLSAAFRQTPPERAPELAAILLRRIGPQRLVWGSDWPFAAFEDSVDYAQTLRAFAACVPDEAHRREMDRAALRLYFS